MANHIDEGMGAICAAALGLANSKKLFYEGNTGKGLFDLMSIQI